jgi:dTDP-4-dehydrorhamnose 3,5-epimerase
LHFQTPPYAQAKLVRVVKGVVQDVAVDIRTGSPTYGKWFSAILSEENKNMMFIPAGFAHGFLTLENNTIFQYKCSQIYHKESEGTIAWNDPTINIKWQSNTPSISAKDQHGQALKNFKNPFSYPEK